MYRHAFRLLLCFYRWEVQVPESNMLSVVFLHGQSCGIRHIFLLFLLANHHVYHCLSLPVCGLLCSELSNCITTEFTAQLFCLCSKEDLGRETVTFQRSIPTPRPAMAFLFHALCAQPYLRPSLPPPHTHTHIHTAPPLLSVSRRLLCKASRIPTESPPPPSTGPGDLLKPYECGHTHKEMDGQLVHFWFSHLPSHYEVHSCLLSVVSQHDSLWSRNSFLRRNWQTQLFVIQMYDRPTYLQIQKLRGQIHNHDPQNELPQCFWRNFKSCSTLLTPGFSCERENKSSLIFLLSNFILKC